LGYIPASFLFFVIADADSVRLQSYEKRRRDKELTGNDGTSYSASILGMVCNNVPKRKRQPQIKTSKKKSWRGQNEPSFISKDVYESFVNTICESRVFLAVTKIPPVPSDRFSKLSDKGSLHCTVIHLHRPSTLPPDNPSC
jgi:hypothetical protein